MGGNFRFQAQDSFLEYFFENGFEKRIALSEKKPPLTYVLLCTYLLLIGEIQFL